MRKEAMRQSMPVRLFRCHESGCIPEEAFAIALAAAFVLVEEACIH